MKPLYRIKFVHSGEELHEDFKDKYYSGNHAWTGVEKELADWNWF